MIQQTSRKVFLSKLVCKLKIQNSYWHIEKEQGFDCFADLTHALNVSTAVYVTAEKYIKRISPCATMIFTTEAIAAQIKQAHNYEGGFIITADVERLFWDCVAIQHSISMYPTQIGDNCIIGELVSIAETDVVIGNNVTIENFATIHQGSRIGDGCVIRAGSVIGSDGFKMCPGAKVQMQLPHFGKIVLGNNVLVQCNCTIDKALYEWDATILAEGCKIDSSTYIAHGAKLGKGCIVCGNTRIEGNTRIGDNVRINFGATIINRTVIEDGAEICMGAVVTKRVKKAQRVFGNPAKPLL